MQTSSSTENKSDERIFLMIFKAYPPHENKERNLCELAREIKGFVDPNHFPPAGIGTEAGVRYGVFSVFRATLLKTADSVTLPKSQKDGVYVLALDRTYKICAKSYSLSNRKIAYIDYENGKSYDFPVKTSQSFPIHEVELTSGNVLRELWEPKRKL